MAIQALWNTGKRRHYDLLFSPNGEIYRVARIVPFVQTHPELFQPEDLVVVRYGKAKIPSCYASRSLSRLASRFRGMTEWKGWTAFRIELEKGEEFPATDDGVLHQDGFHYCCSCKKLHPLEEFYEFHDSKGVRVVCKAKHKTDAKARQDRRYATPEGRKAILNRVEKWRRRDSAQLGDSYVKSAAIKMGVSREDLTPELVELKRAQLKLTRAIKRKEQENAKVRQQKNEECRRCG